MVLPFKFYLIEHLEWNHGLACAKHCVWCIAFDLPLRDQKPRRSGCKSVGSDPACNACGFYYNWISKVPQNSYFDETNIVQMSDMIETKIRL